MDNDGTSEMIAIVGDNLRRLRTRRGLSLDRLAGASGVSRAMLGQIELGRSAPTITLLSKITQALGVPFTALLGSPSGGGPTVLRQAASRSLVSADGRFSARPLAPETHPRRPGFYELRLHPQSSAESPGHAPGTLETLAVCRGVAEIEVQGRIHHLDKGDSILFEADSRHVYRNPGAEEGVYYLVMSEAEQAG